MHDPAPGLARGRDDRESARLTPSQSWPGGHSDTGPGPWPGHNLNLSFSDNLKFWPP